MFCNRCGNIQQQQQWNVSPKKKNNTVAIIVASIAVVIFIIVLMVGIVVLKKVTVEKEYDAYRQLLIDGELEVLSEDSVEVYEDFTLGENPFDAGSYFLLRDIDADGTDELIVTDDILEPEDFDLDNPSEITQNSIFIIFDYENGKVQIPCADYMEAGFSSYLLDDNSFLSVSSSGIGYGIDWDGYYSPDDYTGTNLCLNVAPSITSSSTPKFRTLVQTEVADASGKSIENQYFINEKRVREANWKDAMEQKIVDKLIPGEKWNRFTKEEL